MTVAHAPLERKEASASLSFVILITVIAALGELTSPEKVA
jgi:hypothetical protein